MFVSVSKLQWNSIFQIGSTTVISNFFSEKTVMVTPQCQNLQKFDPFAVYIFFYYKLNTNSQKQDIILITVNDDFMKNIEISQLLPILIFYKLYKETNKKYNFIFVYKRMTFEVKLFDSQVSGKTAKFSDKEGKQMYKQLSKNQYIFYSFMNALQIHQAQYGLKKHIPKFLGKKNISIDVILTEVDDKTKKGEWMNHISDRFKARNIQQNQKQYIALQNLSANFKYPCVMDIKLGRKKKQKKSNKKFQKSTTNSHHFRINGMSNLYLQNNQPHFISKYYFQKTSQEQIQAHLAFFFYNGQKIDQELVKKCIDIIKEIVLALSCFRCGNFDSASLLIVYDAYDHGKFQVKIIDFDQYHGLLYQHHAGDENIIVGLKYIIWYLNNLVKNKQGHEQNLRNQTLKLFHTQQIIPEQKAKQFLTPKSSKSFQSSQKSTKSIQSSQIGSPKSQASKQSESKLQLIQQIEFRIENDY